MKIVFLIICALLLASAVSALREHCRRHPYTAPAEDAADDERDEPQEEQTVSRQTEKELDRLVALQDEHRALLDAIDNEQQALKRELPSASARRASAISSKLTTLAGRRASTTRTIAMIDTRIDRLYDSLYA